MPNRPEKKLCSSCTKYCPIHIGFDNVIVAATNESRDYLPKSFKMGDRVAYSLGTRTCIENHFPLTSIELEESEATNVSECIRPKMYRPKFPNQK